MVKEIEKSGMPIVHVANMVPVSESVGTNKILKAHGIPYPWCDPEEKEEVQAEQRYELLEEALKVLGTDVTEQTVFSIF